MSDQPTSWVIWRQPEPGTIDVLRIGSRWDLKSSVNDSSQIAVLPCRVTDADDSAGWYRRCGCEGVPRDTVTRRLAAQAVRMAADDAAGHDPPIPEAGARPTDR